MPCGCVDPTLGCEAVLIEHSAAPTSMLDEASELPCAVARIDRIRIYAPHSRARTPSLSAGYGPSAATASTASLSWDADTSSTFCAFTPGTTTTIGRTARSSSRLQT